LAADGDVHLNSDERVEIDASVAQLRAHVQADDGDAIKTAVKALERCSASFVERRMNASVKRLMAGQHVDAVAAQLEESEDS